MSYTNDHMFVNTNLDCIFYLFIFYLGFMTALIAKQPGHSS